MNEGVTNNGGIGIMRGHRSVAPAGGYITPERAGEILGYSRQSIYRMVEEGELDGHQLREGGRWRISYNSVMRYRDRQQTLDA